MKFQQFCETGLILKLICQAVEANKDEFLLIRDLLLRLLPVVILAAQEEANAKADKSSFSSALAAKLKHFQECVTFAVVQEEPALTSIIIGP